MTGTNDNHDIPATVVKIAALKLKIERDKAETALMKAVIHAAGPIWEAHPDWTLEQVCAEYAKQATPEQAERFAALIAKLPTGFDITTAFIRHREEQTP